MHILERGGKKHSVLVLLAVAVLVTGLIFGIRVLSHETKHVSGLIAYESVDDLFAQSSLVAVGTMTKQSAAVQIQHASGIGTANFTDYTFALTNVLQGRANGDAVTVRVMGGTVGNRTEIYEGSPAFEKTRSIFSAFTSPTAVAPTIPRETTTCVA